jgi:hypothetical protein
MITSLVSYDYLFGILWLPLWYLMITSLVSIDYLFGILWLPLTKEVIRRYQRGNHKR